MRLLVCGSRDYDDVNTLTAVLDGYFHQVDQESYENYDFVELMIIEGGAVGADRLAMEWATSHHCYVGGRLPNEWESVVVTHQQEQADWRGPCDPAFCLPGHRRTRYDGSDFCPAAGPRRNQHMLDKWNPELVVAFLSKRLYESKGTADMVQRATKAGIATQVVEKRL